MTPLSSVDLWLTMPNLCEGTITVGDEASIKTGGDLVTTYGSRYLAM